MDGLLTTEQVAKLLNVSTRTITRWVQEEGMPVRRLTSRILRFQKNEVMGWTMDRGIHPPQSELVDMDG